MPGVPAGFARRSPVGGGACGSHRQIFLGLKSCAGVINSPVRHAGVAVRGKLGGSSPFPRGLQQALLPPILSPLCTSVPHPHPVIRALVGWRQRDREFKGHLGVGQPELHVSKPEAKSNKSIGIFI